MLQPRVLLSFVLISTALSTAASAEPSSALVKLPSGVTLHYVVQGRADGEPIVLLHGIGDSWHSWELVLRHLPDRHRVYAVSLRGHGWSDGPATGYTQADFAGDVAAFMDTLDLRRVTLVGHSLGSFVAQAVATRHGARVARVVLVGSGPGGIQSESVRAEGQQAFGAIKAPIDPLFARDFQASTISGPVPATFLETMFGEIMRSAPQMWSQAVAALYDADTAAALRNLTIPALLLWGDKDSMLRRPEQDALLAAIPHARLVAYAGAGHATHWEQPERVARDIIAFAQR